MNDPIELQAKATPPAQEIKIALWAGPRSGKSTYLAALLLAAFYELDDYWSITGVEREYQGSSMFLAVNASMLRKCSFPHSTTVPGEYKFEIRGRVTPRLLAGLPVHEREMAGGERQVNFTLYLNDYCGVSFQDTTEIHGPNLSYLADCDGLIILRDVGSGNDDSGYFSLTSQLLWQAADERRRVNNKLPHFLAMCVSRFDSPDVFEPLMKEGLVRQNMNDPRQTPYVTDPKRAFEALADTQVTKTVQTMFHPDRIQYFFSSSIGFYAPPHSPINLEDYCNVVPTLTSPKIRSGRHTFPVNVFTPLLWIENQVTTLAKNQP